MTLKKDCLAVMALCAALALAAIFFRPALPIDETRYLTVAWEMFLKHNYFLPTMNFQPYHHKPPLLFWLINLSWEIFGVHRWGAVLVMSAVSSAALALLSHFSKMMFPEQVAMNERLKWIVIGSAPFLIYGTLIMFDFILALCAVATWVFALHFMKSSRKRYIAAAGIAMGFGVLAKGPVILIFTLLPFLLAPLWTKEMPPRKKYYFGLLGMFVVGLIPVAAWLIPVYLGTSLEFFEWLVFKQTAGRVTGNFGGAHPRPFYFYIPIFIALFVPWLFFPQFWKQLKATAHGWRKDDVLRFCFFTIVPAFVIFSAISGKQPHYMVPLSLFVMLLIAKLMENVPLRHIRAVAVAMVFLFVAGQAVAWKVFFPRYDLRPVADIVAANPDKDWAYVPNYNAEIGFLARSGKPVEALDEFDQLPAWFAAHPDGMAMVRYSKPETVAPYNVLFTMDYAGGKKVSVVQQAPEYP